MAGRIMVKTKIVAAITLITIVLPGFPVAVLGLDLNAKIRKSFGALTERRDQLVDSINKNAKQLLKNEEIILVKLTEGGFSSLEQKTGLNEKNQWYQIAKNRSLESLGFRLGASKGAMDLAVGTFSFFATLDKLPAQVKTLGGFAKNTVSNAVAHPRTFANSLYNGGKKIITAKEANPLKRGKIAGEVSAIGMTFGMGGGGVVKTLNKAANKAKNIAKVSSTVKTAISTNKNNVGTLLPDITKANIGFSQTSDIAGIGSAGVTNMRKMLVATSDALSWEKIPTLKNLAVRQKEFSANSLRACDKELAVMLGKVIENSAFRIRVSGQETLKQIIKDGKFKTQFEVGKSSIWYNPEDRRLLSSKLFGTDLKTIKDDQFEVYGYLGNKDFVGEAGNRVLTNYGDVIITLKRNNLFPRTTFTLGDSYVHYVRSCFEDLDAVVASKLDNINTICGVNKDISLIKMQSQGKEILTPVDLTKLGAGIRYIEAQFHGGVRVKDIESVTLIEKYSKFDPDLYQLLKSNGVKMNYLEKATELIKEVI